MNRIVTLAILQAFTAFANGSPLWIPMPFTQGMVIEKPLDPECYEHGVAHDRKKVDKALEAACDAFSGYVWGNGGWATQVSNPFWDSPMELSKSDCMDFLLPIVNSCVSSKTQRVLGGRRPHAGCFSWIVDPDPEKHNPGLSVLKDGKPLSFSGDEGMRE
ncbi:hypothetical protein Q7P37_009748 [Cladosporium fusiforme]